MSHTNHFCCLRNANIPTKVILVLLLCGNCMGINFPIRVIGLFRSEKSAPAVAAQLAVETMNESEDWSAKPNFTFIYKNDTADVEFSTDLQKLTVMVTGNPATCERISKVSRSFPFLLICYGPPSVAILQNIKNIPNLYLSQHNPKAIIPCLVKMMELFTRVSRSSCPTVSMLVDRSHSYYELEKPLFSNLAQMNMRRVSLRALEKCINPSDNQSLADLHVMVTVLKPVYARDLLCKLYHKKSYGQNLILIFAGLSGDELLAAIQKNEVLNGRNTTQYHRRMYDDGFNHNIVDNDKFICTSNELLTFAEGHFLLEFPAWDTNDQSVKYRLYQRLEHIRSDFSEAPLAYDSVWAILHAINRSTFREGQAEKSMEEYIEAIKEELTTSCNGVSGEISFNHERLRNTNKATTVIKRLENGSFVEIGRHSNANSSFYGLKNVFPFSGQHLSSSSSDEFSSENITECYLHCEVTDPEPDLPSCKLPMVLKMTLFGVLPLTFLLFVLISQRKRILRQNTHKTRRIILQE